MFYFEENIEICIAKIVLEDCWMYGLRIIPQKTF